MLNSSISDKGTFSLSPLSLNITENSEAVFQCQHTTAASINWKINGSILREVPQGVRAYLNHNGVYVLIITALYEYNPTLIDCVAYFVDSQSEESYQAVMKIQGKLYYFNR